MIVSSSGVLGKGTLAQALESTSGNLSSAEGLSNEEARLFNLMGMNFRGQTLGNRLVHFITPKRFYSRKHNKEVYGGMMHQYADDAKRLQTRGFKDKQGKWWWLCFIGNLGDLPQQVKTGGLKRSFNNVVKSGTSNTSKGICICCPAGQEGFEFENMSLAAPFFSAMYQDEPWDENAAIFQLVRFQRRLAKIFRVDIWHGFHLGTGMIFVGSGLVEAMQLMGDGSVLDKLEIMNAKLESFQLETGSCELSFSALTKERLGWPTVASYPKGGWQKATDTVQLLKFLIHLLEEVTLEDNSILQVIKEAACVIDWVFSSLYRANMFLFGDTARDIAVAGLKFLQLNMKLARMCYDVGKNRFLQMPKLHTLHNVFATMLFGFDD